MSYVTLPQAKAHLLVIHDFDDGIIQDCIDAAESYAATYMNRPAIEDNPLNPWKANQGTIADWARPLRDCRPFDPVVSSELNSLVPASVVQAVKLLLADYYENRTAGIVGTTYSANPAAENLLNQQRIGWGV